MDQELQNILGLVPLHIPSAATAELATTTVNENLSRATRLIDYLESRGFTFGWAYQTDGRFTTSAVDIACADAEKPLLAEIKGLRPPMMALMPQYVVAVLCTRDIIARCG